MKGADVIGWRLLGNAYWCFFPEAPGPGLHVHHQLPEFTQTHVHWVGDAIQPSHPLLSPSNPAFNLSQHQGLFRSRTLFIFDILLLICISRGKPIVFYNITFLKSVFCLIFNSKNIVERLFFPSVEFKLVCAVILLWSGRKHDCVIGLVTFKEKES